MARWGDQGDGQPVLLYGDLFHPLCKFLHCAESFYRATGFHGTLLVRVSLHNVAGETMTFYRFSPLIFEDLSPNDFRCIADVVSAERLVDADRIATNKLDVLTDFLGELALSFWQSLREFPRDRLNAYAAVHGMGLA